MSLTPAQRQQVRHDIAEALSRILEPLAVTKPDLLAAVNATDDWIDTNAASFNNALPQPAQSALTSAQKARLFMIVAQARFGG